MVGSVHPVSNHFKVGDDVDGERWTSSVALQDPYLESTHPSWGPFLGGRDTSVGDVGPQV